MFNLTRQMDVLRTEYVKYIRCKPGKLPETTPGKGSQKKKQKKRVIE